MKLAICGPGRSGKDTAADRLAATTPLRYAFSTSWVIAERHFATLGYPTPEAAFARRHADRMRWFDLGCEMRRDDPAALARRTLDVGDICVGVRDGDEIRAVIREGLVDLVAWVERPGLPVDPTLTYGVEVADVVVRNDGTIDEFHRRVDRLAATWRLAGPHSPPAAVGGPPDGPWESES